MAECEKQQEKSWARWLIELACPMVPASVLAAKAAAKIKPGAIVQSASGGVASEGLKLPPGREETLKPPREKQPYSSAQTASDLFEVLVSPTVRYSPMHGSAAERLLKHTPELLNRAADAAAAATRSAIEHVKENKNAIIESLKEGAFFAGALGLPAAGIGLTIARKGLPPAVSGAPVEQAESRK